MQPPEINLRNGSDDIAVVAVVVGVAVVGVGQVFGVVTSEFLTDFYVRRPDLLELD